MTYFIIYFFINTLSYRYLFLLRVDLNNDALYKWDITTKLGLLTTESLNEEEDQDRETEGFTSLRIEHESIGFRRDE